MKPSVALLGFALGSAASITFGLIGVVVVFLFLPPETPALAQRATDATRESRWVCGFDSARRAEFLWSAERSALATGRGRGTARRIGCPGLDVLADLTAAVQRFLCRLIFSHEALRLKAPVLYGSKPSSFGRSSVSFGLSRSSKRRGLSSVSAAGFFAVGFGRRRSLRRRRARGNRLGCGDDRLSRGSLEPQRKLETAKVEWTGIRVPSQPASQPFQHMQTTATPKARSC